MVLMKEILLYGYQFYLFIITPDNQIQEFKSTWNMELRRFTAGLGRLRRLGPFVTIRLRGP